MERVLLLGGTGFIGRALAVRLRDRGIEVHAVTRSIQLSMPEGIVAHAGGMENSALLRTLLPRMDAVVHLASVTTPGLSHRTPSLEAGNLSPTLGLIEELQRYPGVRLIFVSSGGTVYGASGEQNTSEAAVPQPLSYYGVGKLAIEEFLRCYERQSRTPVAILRPSNVYGQGQPLYQGFAVVRTMLQHALEGTTMGIWGDGSIVRDFIHIDDMIAAIECALADPSASGTFNVGAGQGHSLNELAEIIGRVSERRLRVEYQPARGIDVKRIVLDCDLMSERFCWRPTVDLQTGVAATWEWLRSTRGSFS